MKKRTKIVATIGPASGDRETLRRLLGAGMDVARLNFSHGTQAEHAATVARIRSLERESGRHVAVLADMGGPKIRTGAVPGGAPLPLSKGQKVVFAPEGKACGEEIPVSLADLARDLTPGSLLLIDDGGISVKVTGIRGQRIEARVLGAGILRDHKGINLPGAVLSAGALTKKDEADLRFALSIGVDIVGLSFVQDAADVERARSVMRRAKREVPVVAKIERRIALERLERIVAAADAAMVARGDLGVEIPLERVPVVQKQIIAACARHRKPVIVATQMLESMVRNARPTRAEATDVSNAVFEGTDAVMLSAETSIGEDPVNAVRTMARIVNAAESSVYILRRTYVPDEEDRSVELAAARAACFAAEETCARAICVFTQTGNSARIIASQRPGTDIIAIARSDDAVRRMELYWGVRPMKIRRWKSIDEMIEAGFKTARERGALSPGDKVVVVSGSDTAPGATNMVRIIEA